MAKKKVVFDPNEDPQTGFDKWTQEFLRIKDEALKSTVAEEEEANQHRRYFREKLAEKKSPLEEPEQKPGKIDQRKYKKPWPGWGKVVEKL